MKPLLATLALSFIALSTPLAPANEEGGSILPEPRCKEVCYKDPLQGEVCETFCEPI